MNLLYTFVQQIHNEFQLRIYRISDGFIARHVPSGPRRGHRVRLLRFHNVYILTNLHDFWHTSMLFSFLVHMLSLFIKLISHKVAPRQQIEFSFRIFFDDCYGMCAGQLASVQKRSHRLLNVLHNSATCWIQLNDPCAGAMLPYVKLLWQLVIILFH